MAVAVAAVVVVAVFVEAASAETACTVEEVVGAREVEAEEPLAVVLVVAGLAVVGHSESRPEGCTQHAVEDLLLVEVVWHWHIDLRFSGRSPTLFGRSAAMEVDLHSRR